MPRTLAILAALVLTSSAAFGGTISIDFEGLTDLTSVTNQYAGLTFEHAIILTSGISLNEIDFPPHSGVNVICDDGGPLSITFLQPALAFSGYFTYSAALTVTAFDTNNVLAATARSKYMQNFVSSGNPANELIRLSWSGGIGRIVIEGDASGGSFALDDLSTSPYSPVPEPANFGLALLGGAVFLARSASKRSSKVAAAGLILLTTAVTAMGQAVPLSINAAGASPTAVLKNTPTSVVVTALVGDSALLSGSVNLQRISSGGAVSTLAVMTDNGLNGDAVAGDRIYSARIVLNEATTGNVSLQVSAAFRGQLRRSVVPVSVTIVAGYEASGTATSSSGGVVVVSHLASPIYGTVVTIPAGATPNGGQVGITLSYTDVPPGTLPVGAVQSGKVIILSKDTPQDFLLPATVTVPFNPSVLDSGDVPGVFYWNPDTGRYEAAPVLQVDRTLNLITFRTVHFSSFIPLAIKSLAKQVIFGAIDTGFRPNLDGFFHPNFGAYDSPGGSCLGMASFAQWYYQNKKPGDGALYSKFRQGDYSDYRDDTTARELISRAMVASSRIWASVWYQLGVITARDTGLLLITAMKLTGEPQILILRGFDGLGMPTWGHAVNVYAWDDGPGHFRIYDNNFPGEEVTLDWSPSTGFANYSKGAAYPSARPVQYGFDALATAFSGSDLDSIYQGALAGFPNTKFRTITVTTPTVDATGTAAVASGAPVSVQGTVTGGIMDSCCLAYYLNGRAPGITTLSGNGSFQFQLSTVPNPSNSLMLVATNQPNDVNPPWNAYAGFKEITLQAQGQNFFQNLGFETATFNSWVHETHTWLNTAPGSFTPEKSAIVTGGADPIDPGIQTVHNGIYAARVNNWDNDYHISSFSQTATVPNVTNPQLQFYWAAVLEDPAHAPADQPYVDVLVTDNTTNTPLYSKHFYTNDPSYSGWRTVYYVTTSSTWRTIPWQVVQLNLQSAVGHSITLKVTAADCALGGHGGYVYLDAPQ